VLSVAGLLGLAGCGFRPLYGPVTAPDGTSQDIVAELAAVRVGPTYDRSGQLLRRSLMRRMEGMAPGTQGRYLLNVAISMNADVLGYRQDGSISRIRFILTGNWVLSTLAVPPQEIARAGIPYKSLDSFDIPDLQFFAADSARDAMEARMMEDVADQLTRQVILALRRRQAAPPPPRPA